MIFTDPGDTTRCNIISTSFCTLTTDGGAIINGTENVTIYCLCTRGSSFPVAVGLGNTSWFLNGDQITRDEADETRSPYFKETVPLQLIIPSFVSPHNGTYTCGPTTNIDDATSNITLNLTGMILL